MTITYKQLQSNLKTLRDEHGYELNCKLNARKEVLEAEYARLEALIKAELEETNTLINALQQQLEEVVTQHSDIVTHTSQDTPKPLEYKPELIIKLPVLDETDSILTALAIAPLFGLSCLLYGTGFTIMICLTILYVTCNPVTERVNNMIDRSIELIQKAKSTSQYVYSKVISLVEYVQQPKRVLQDIISLPITATHKAMRLVNLALLKLVFSLA